MGFIQLQRMNKHGDLQDLTYKYKPEEKERKKKEPHMTLSEFFRELITHIKYRLRKLFIWALVIIIAETLYIGYEKIDRIAERNEWIKQVEFYHGAYNRIITEHPEAAVNMGLNISGN